jgi:hypothetical protein
VKSNKRSSYMANKTNPIGVRFNKELLEQVKVSPQKALNLYEDNFLKKDQEPENPPPPPENKGNDERDKILQQIADIKKETIPDVRNTPIGKKVWQADQQHRINTLLNKLI